jgi:hypothetical protein
MENEQLISGKAYIKLHNFRLTPKRAENLYTALHNVLRQPLPLVIKTEHDQVFAVLKKKEFPSNVFKSLEIFFRIPEKTEKEPSEKFLLIRTSSLVNVNKEFIICTSCSGVEFLKSWEIIRHITHYFQHRNNTETQ